MSPSETATNRMGRIRYAITLACAVFSVFLAMGQTSMSVAAVHLNALGEIQLSDGGWATPCVGQTRCHAANDIALGLSQDSVPTPHHHHHGDTHWGTETDFAGYALVSMTLAASIPTPLINGVEQSPTSVIEQPPRA